MISFNYDVGTFDDRENCGVPRFMWVTGEMTVSGVREETPGR